MAGKSNRDIIYKCTICKREVGKPNLKVKRVQYCDMGTNGRVEKSRVIAWLCMIPQPDGEPSCLDSDEHYGNVARFAAPGLQDVIHAG